ncbi:glycosyl hydrolase [Actinoallomurus sp. CA-150999]|uniref:glycosyl hydrolase n=1 Tax=Actinoallomurus sp. CA-150999 TaxID=3239887 RepID=UPI003D9322E6
MPALSAGTFADPPATVRPKYRWWLPVADTSDTELRRELGQIAQAGGGGVEVTAFPVPHATTDPVFGSRSYLDVNGWGTPKWRHRLQVIAEAARNDGLILDMAAGPAWPPVVPSVHNFNQPAAAQQLIYGAEFTDAGRSRDGALPPTTTNPPTVNTLACAPTAGGATDVRLASTAGLAVGDRITLGTGADLDAVTVERVGTSMGCTTAATDTAAGASIVSVTDVPDGLRTGDRIVIGSGAGEDVAAVTDLGSQSQKSTLYAAADTGATSVVVANDMNLQPGGTVVIGIGSDQETRTVTNVAHSNSGRPGTLTLDAPLEHAQARGAATATPSGGITVTPALPHRHPAGDLVRRYGGATATVVTPAAHPHPAGAPVVDTAKTTLVAVVAAQCGADCAPGGAAPQKLDRASVRDVTKLVDAGGGLHYTFPVGNGHPWVLLDFYRTADGRVQTTTAAEAPDYALDHLSARGADAMGDFWDQAIISRPTHPGRPPGLPLSAHSGGAIFEDSLELGYNETWTADFADRFRERRGYSVAPFLPALAGAAITRKGPVTPAFDFSDGTGDRVRWDYAQTWSDLYADRYLPALQRWTESHGMTLRAQPYGDPIDAAHAAEHIGIPEGEGLEFSGHDPDQLFKVIASGAYMSGAPVVSSECCAMAGKVWATTVAQNLATQLYPGMAGGDNQVVWHGFPYLTAPPGSGEQTRWPGFSYGGNTSFAEAWGPRMPQWSDMKAVNDHLARLSLVLRQGTPQFDVGVYYQNLGLAGQAGDRPETIIPDTSAMAGAGYTYGYVSPEFLKEPSATYSGGRLFPGRSGYRALLLNDQRTYRRDAADKILGLARQGLPIVIVGSDHPPTVTTPGYGPADDAVVRKDIDTLYSYIGDGRHHVARAAAQDDVPAALASLGVTAAAAHVGTGSGRILDVRRHTADADYYFLYNDSDTAADQTVRLTGDGAAYRLDTWTGRITSLGERTAGSHTVTVPVRLAAHDVMVIAVGRADRFGTPAAPPRTPGGTVAVQWLTSWDLTVDSWTPGRSGRPDDTAHTALGPITVTADAAGALPAWTRIAKSAGYPVDLADVAGVGTYTTRVRLGTLGHGAYLDLGAVVDTCRVSVNGHALPPLDSLDVGHVDIGRYLRPGDNTITVRVATPLINAVRVAPGTGAAGRQRTDNGLIGPVTLTSTR